MDATNSWFETTARRNFERAFLPVSNQPNLRYLQIGVYEGDASVWLMENVLTSPSSILYDVDTWDGGNSPEFDGINFQAVEDHYDRKTEHWRATGQIIKSKTSSIRFFADCIHNDEFPFDFIYIDGDHSTVGTLEDAVLAYRLLKPMGMICFDDYTWQSKHGALAEPTMAIDMVKVMYAGRLRVLRVGQQAWFQRVDAEVRR